MSHNLKRLLIAVYICLVCLLAIATFLEQACGTDFVEKYIYHTFWFCCLWGILAALAAMEKQVHRGRFLWRSFGLH